MGSLKRGIKDVDSAILTICLRDLLKKPDLDAQTRLSMTKDLLDNGADPLKVTNVYLKDFPLRFAVLNADNEMISLFLRYISENDDNKKVLTDIIRQVSQNNIIHADTSRLQAFVRNP